MTKYETKPRGVKGEEEKGEHASNTGLGCKMFWEKDVSYKGCI